MDEKPIQGTTVNRFTVRDIPLVGRSLSRWGCIDDNVKREVGNLIKTTLADQKIDIKHRLAAGALAERIDRLNLKHEEFYTPTMDIDVGTMSDEELRLQIEKLEQDQLFHDVMKTLLNPPDSILLEIVPPMTDCVPHPAVSVIDKYMGTGKGTIAQYEHRERMGARESA